MLFNSIEFLAFFPIFLLGYFLSKGRVRLWWMLTGSLESVTDTLRVPPNLFPRDANLENFVNLFTSTSAPRWFLNSVFVSAPSGK